MNLFFSQKLKKKIGRLRLAAPFIFVSFSLFFLKPFSFSFSFAIVVVAAVVFTGFY